MYIFYFLKPIKSFARGHDQALFKEDDHTLITHPWNQQP
jgi:hypothetical protein